MDPVQSNLNQPKPQEHIFNKVLKVTLILLILISIGFGGFLFLQLNKKQSTNTTVPTLVVSPTVGIKKDQTIISPTVQSKDPNNIDAGDVEGDLKDIGIDVESLQ